MRTTTWENLGTTFTGNEKLISGLPEAMCFKVDKKPMGFMTDANEFQRVNGTSTVVDEFGRAYGPVSDNYGVVDNPTALGALQYIEGMDIVKYGALNNGMQFIIGKLDEVNILGDAFTPYLIFRNSFNGKFPIQAAICPLRIVCQNQFNIAFKEAQNTINIKHTAKAEQKLEQAREILLGTADYLANLKAKAEKYATIKVSEAEVAHIIEDLFPLKDTMSERQAQVIKDKRAAFIAARLANDNANFRNTVWGMINAYTDFITHEQPVRQTKTQSENQFLAVTFDPRIMAKMMEIINARTLIA